ncbi:MAG: glycosyltransferase [bacterium]|nr:glycosyltransferase [bacterium]
MKINVVHLVYSLDPGGLENGVVNIVNGMDMECFNPMICCLKSGGILKERVKSSIEVIEVDKKGKQELGVLFRLKKIFKDRDVHVVHTHNWGTCCEGVIGARLASVPVPVVIHQEHGTFVDSVGSKKRRIWGERIVLRYADQVMTLSEDLKEKMIKILGIPGEKIKVILNGVDIEKFSFLAEKRTRKRQELGIAEDRLVVGTVGRLEAVKNQRMLIQAMPELLKKFPDVMTVIIGDGILKAELINMAKELGLSEHILFPGVRNDVAEILSAMDLFIISSLTEGICNAILEAMSCGLPVIATDVGGNPEIVLDGKTGLLVALSDMVGFVAAIEDLLGNKEKRKEYGRNGQEMVEQRFSLQRMVREYESLYRFLLQKKKIII